MTIFHLNYFIEQGKYSEMKHYEFITNSIRDNVRLFQMNTEELRIEWKELGVVSKFVSNKEYSWDKDALKETFYDLGILVHACSICNKRLSEDQLTTLINNNMMMEEKFVRFSPNKKLKYNDIVWWADMDIKDQLVVWQEYHRKLEKLSTEWFRREFAARGFICMSEIQKYREVKDVKLKFFLMEIPKEQAMHEFIARRLKLLSHLSIIRTSKVI